LEIRRKPLLSTTDLAYTIVMTALTTVVTMVIRIPLPVVGGYASPGEVIIIFAALTCGSVVGGLSAGIGSALADILGGYPFWAPITLLIKVVEGAIIGKLGYHKNMYWKIAAALIGQFVMWGGYFLAYIPLYGWAAAVLSSIPVLPSLFIALVIGLPLHYAVIKAYPRLENK